MRSIDNDDCEPWEMEMESEAVLESDSQFWDGMHDPRLFVLLSFYFVVCGRR